ncbi:MAG: sigma-70 family RNA polymerase sigma factor [Saprospiraceae bacterium]|nr:sigma-70 family RNA polymerase sigma factor [Saprospiraceae bacterium]
MTEQELIRGCKRQDPLAQRALYDQYSSLLFGIVRRYVRHQEDAEDVFVEGMFKILTRIASFREEGSFEGWMKRIMVNEALMFLRKKNNLRLVADVSELQIGDETSIEHQIHADEILALVDQLPTGYRTVFNMYVVEGYKHREIAEALDISINTSKSQLILAKKRMRELLKKNRFHKTAS